MMRLNLELICRPLIFSGLFVTACSNAAALAVPAIQAEQIVSSGNGRGAPPCTSCHGAAGEGNAAAGFPRLAGLAAGYLRDQLAHFAGGQRQNAVMMPISKALSAAEMASLADYYARLTGSANAAPRSSGAVAAAASAAGEQLAKRGRGSDDVPACNACHGDGGVGIGADFPALAGQPSSYLVNQLQAWRNGTRDPGPLGLMAGIAKRLLAADAQAVADYFSKQKPASMGETP